MMIRGEGVEPNSKEAMKWLERAAARNYVRAQLLLGYMAAGGGGNRKPDLGEADFWWALAGKQGSKEAKEARNLLRPKLLSADILESQRRQREFRRLFEFLPRPFKELSGGTGFSNELLEAASAGDTKALLKALLEGADVDGQDLAGRTAMINAAWRGRKEIIQILLEHGADVEVADKKVRTPIMWSAINGHCQVIDDLLLAGSEPDHEDEEGLTPLMRASWNGHLQIVNRLLLEGANPAHRDLKGLSALDHARREKNVDVVERLKEIKP